MAAAAAPPPSANLAALRRAYDRWAETRGGNVDEVLALMDDDIVMDSIMPAEVPHALSGSRSRKDEARGYFAALLDEWEMVDWQVDRFIDGGDDIVMVGRCHWRHRASGQEVRSPKVDIWHFENGKATQFFELFDSLGFARAIGAV